MYTCLCTAALRNVELLILDNRRDHLGCGEEVYPRVRKRRPRRRRCSLGTFFAELWIRPDIDLIRLS